MVTGILAFLLRPKIILIPALAFVAVAFLWGLHEGNRRRVRLAADAAGYARGVAEVRAQVLAAQLEAMNLAHAESVELENKDAKARIVYRTITKEVDRLIAGSPLYFNVCLDADGLRFANAALTASEPAAATGEPHSILP